MLLLLLLLLPLLSGTAAVRLRACESGAEPADAVEVSVDAGVTSGSAGAAFAVAAALGWEPGVEPFLHREDGRRVPPPVAASQLAEGELIYAVHPNRHWLWPTGAVRRRRELTALTPSGAEEPWAPGLPPPILTTLATAPRLFSVENFLSDGEVEELLDNTKKGQSAFALKRSSTGANGADKVHSAAVFR